MRDDFQEYVPISWEEGLSRINRCDYFFIDQIGEASELELHVTLVEARTQAPITERREGPLGQILVGARPIEPNDDSLRFRLVFARNDMVSYTVQNETYCKYPKPPEAFEGKLFRIFSQSNLLDFTKRTTNATDEWPGILHHFQVASLNHVLDVIATARPKIFVRDPVAVSETQRQAGRELAQLGGSQPDIKLPRRRRPWF